MSNSPTADKAWEAAQASIDANRRLLYDIIKEAGNSGKTCDELVTETTLTVNVISARLSELRRYNYIERNGEERLSVKNCKAAVLVATDKDSSKLICPPIKETQRQFLNRLIAMCEVREDSSMSLDAFASSIVEECFARHSVVLR